MYNIIARNKLSLSLSLQHQFFAFLLAVHNLTLIYPMRSGTATERPSVPPRRRDPPVIPSPQPNGSDDLPIWLEESSASYKWRSMPLPIRKAIRIPTRFWRFVKKWSKGPREVQIQKIRPFFPSIQTVPLRLVERYLVRRSYQVLAVLLYWLSYVAIFALLLSRSAGSGHIEGYGLATPVSCGESLW